MTISSVEIENLRIISRGVVKPSRGLNWFTGPNASGKSSVLEAIYLAARGRSFRHADAGPRISEGKDYCQVVIRWATSSSPASAGSDVLGLRRERRNLVGRFNGEAVVTRSRLASILPLFWVGPQPQQLLDGGPDNRRRFFDKGLFHVEPSYLATYAEFTRCLNQRNRALKAGNPAEIAAWDIPFVAAAEALQALRRRYFGLLSRAFSSAQEEVGLSFSMTMDLRQGWSEGDALAEALQRRLTLDRRHGFTSVGPQRSDLVLKSDGHVAEKRLSRGQQKIAVILLNLTLMDLALVGATPLAHPPVLLIDDFNAELDPANQGRILEALARRQVQSFFSQIDPPGNVVTGTGSSVFHVEHGTPKLLNSV